MCYVQIVKKTQYQGADMDLLVDNELQNNRINHSRSFLLVTIMNKFINFRSNVISLYTLVNMQFIQNIISL